MLTLNRKTDESIIISTPSGETIKIVLISTCKSHSKIGIQAPQNYRILREELNEKIE